MKEEVKKILKMIEEKKLTAIEAEKLLDSMEPEISEQPGQDPKFIRINIVSDGITKVKMKVPISLIAIALKLGTKIGPKFVPDMDALKDIDVKDLIVTIKKGGCGKIVDVQSKNAIIEIYAE